MKKIPSLFTRSVDGRTLAHECGGGTTTTSTVDCDKAKIAAAALGIDR